jgi:adenylate cyclase
MFMPCAHGVGTSASQLRLEQLIAERLKPGADKAQIDRRIWDLLGEHWAVMCTDLSGFSRRVAEFGIIHFIQTIYESLRIFTPCLDRHDGILLKIEADSLLVIFRQADSALECALAMQKATREYNEARQPEDHVLLCVGLGCGEMLRVGDEDVFGAEVNAASKLGEDMAKAGDILVTEKFHKALTGRLGLQFERLDAAPSGADAAFRCLYSKT